MSDMFSDNANDFWFLPNAATLPQPQVDEFEMEIGQFPDPAYPTVASTPSNIDSFQQGGHPQEELG